MRKLSIVLAAVFMSVATNGFAYESASHNAKSTFMSAKKKPVAKAAAANPENKQVVAKKAKKK
ncbi:MAG: hypothetical protein ACKVQA_17630 [Burkholderiales bacterium]